jgi:5-methylcytosine-specific restriction protein A
MITKKPRDMYPEEQNIKNQIVCFIYKNGGEQYQSRPKDIYKPLADYFSLDITKQTLTRNDALNDGSTESYWHNIVQTARNSLNKEGYLAVSSRGFWRLSEEGILTAKRICNNEESEKRFFSPLNNSNLEKPEGIKQPERREQAYSIYERELEVKEWIIKNAQGKCECCSADGFIKEDGTAYLEAHHLLPLSEKGSDTPQNVIALCANCHRKFHYAKDKEEMRKALIKRIERLQEEYTISL